MTGMKEVARLQFQYMLVTCEVAKDGKNARVRCVNLESRPDGVPEPIWENTLGLEPTDEIRNPAYRLNSLFDEACRHALSLYTRSEWRSSLSKAGIEI